MSNLNSSWTSIKATLSDNIQELQDVKSLLAQKSELEQDIATRMSLGTNFASSANLEAFEEDVKSRVQRLKNIKSLLIQEQSLKNAIKCLIRNNSIAREEEKITLEEMIESKPTGSADADLVLVGQFKRRKTSPTDDQVLGYDEDRGELLASDNGERQTNQTIVIGRLRDDESYSGGESATIDAEQVTQFEADKILARKLQEEWAKEDNQHQTDKVEGKGGDDEKPSSVSKQTMNDENYFSDCGSKDSDGSSDWEENWTPDEDVASPEKMNDLMNHREHAGDEVKYVKYDKAYEICCYKCRCRKECTKVLKEVLKSPEKGKDDGWYVRLHRKCCTTLKKIEGEYAVTTYGIAMSSDAHVPRKKNQELMNTLNSSFLLERKKANDALGAKFDQYFDQVQLRSTDDRYLKAVQQYDKDKERARAAPKHAANVLSLFSGVGGGILVLKRLKIRINNCVVVEHDGIAEAVCSANHKNKDIGIYHHIPTFEELEENIDSIVEEYGPFHIIDGGPPCTEYTGVNANKSGVESRKGKYMVKYGKLIQSIKEHPKQMDTHLYFLCENVPMQWGDQKQIEDVFEISPIQIDARLFSPSKRNRIYYTNFVTEDLPSLKSKATLSKVSLTDGWMEPGQLYCDLHGEQTTYSKTLTFMASEGRIDDARMIKVRKCNSKKANGFEGDYYSVADREALMGYPGGYVETPVTEIFEKLNASFHAKDWALVNDLGCYQMDILSGKHYKFTWDKKVKVGTAEKSKDGKILYYYDCDGYCKRLLGNGYSIPVVEHLMRPLKDLFSEKEYDGAMYDYAWDHNL